MSTVADWIVEHTNDITDNENIELIGAVEGYAKWSDAWQAQNEVWYSIVEGNNKECGYGSFNGVTTFSRTTVHSTLIDGVYNNVNPVRMVLKGTAVVGCTYNADAFDQLETDVPAIGDIPGLQDELDSKVDDTDLQAHYNGTEGRHSTDDINFPTDVVADIPSLQLAIDYFESATIISGCALSLSATPGAVDMANGSCLFRVASGPSEFETFTIQLVPTTLAIPIVDGSSALIYLRYNGAGVEPSVEVQNGAIKPADIINLGNTTRVPVGVANRVGNEVTYVTFGTFGITHAWRNEIRLIDQRIAIIKNSAIISKTGDDNLQIAMTAGTYYFGVTRLTSPAYPVVTFTYWHLENGTNWTPSAGSNAIDNLNKQGGTNKEPITPDQYTVNWVYGIVSELGMDVHILYSDQDVATAAEITETPPAESALPPVIRDNIMAGLLGRIIIQQGNPSLIEVASSLEDGVEWSVASSHNELSGIQGGVAGEYYHLSSEVNAIINGGEFKGYGEWAEDLGDIVGTATVNTTVSNVFYANVVGDVVIDFTNTLQTCASFTLILTNGGGHAVTWGNEVKWPGATAPTLTATEQDLLIFTRVNNTWFGNSALDMRVPA
mgnify:CR=1 FL=1